MAQLQFIDRNIQEGAWNDAWDRLRRGLNTKPGDPDWLTRLWTVVQSEPGFRDRAIELLTDTQPDDTAGRTELMLSLLGYDREPSSEWPGREAYPARLDGTPTVELGLDPFVEGRRLQRLNDFDGALSAFFQVTPTSQNYPMARASIAVIRDMRLPRGVKVRLSPGEKI